MRFFGIIEKSVLLALKEVYFWKYIYKTKETNSILHRNPIALFENATDPSNVYDPMLPRVVVIYN